MLPRPACCVLSRLRCNGHSLLLGSYLSRIGRIENPSCSACGHPSQDTSHLILHYPDTDSLRRSLFGDSLLCTTSGPDFGELPILWGSIVIRQAPIPRKGSGKQQQQASFHVSGEVNENIVQIWRSQTFHEVVEKDSSKLNVWCGLMHNQIIGPIIFAESTITADIYVDMLKHLRCSSIIRVPAVCCVLARWCPSTLGFHGS